MRRILIDEPEWIVALALASLAFDTAKFGPAGLVSPSNAAFVLAVLCVGASRVVKRVPIRRGELFAVGVALLFLVSFIPSVLTAVDRAQAGRVFVSIIGMAALFVVIVLASRTTTTYARLVYAWLLAGLVAGAFAVAQWVAWLVFGVIPSDAGIAGICGTPFVTLRATGIAGSPNYLGFFLIPSAVVAAAMVHRQRGLVVGYAAVIAVTCVLGVLATDSRGAVGSLLFAAAGAGYLFVLRTSPRLWIRVAALAVLMLGLLLLARVLIGFNEAGLIARVNIVNNALRSIGMSPITGSGLGSETPISSDITGSCDTYTVITAVPTTIPTSVPTIIATTVPTTEPSGVPTSRPTIVVTTRPTTVPTTVPTTLPTTVVAVTREPSPSFTTSTPSPPPSASVSAVGVASSPPDSIVGRRDTHVTVLQALQNSGVVGLLGYTVLVLGTLWYGTRAWDTRSRLRTGLVLAALACQVCALVTDALQIKQLYVGLAMLWAIAALEVERTSVRG